MKKAIHQNCGGEFIRRYWKWNEMTCQKCGATGFVVDTFDRGIVFMPAEEYSEWSGDAARQHEQAKYVAQRDTLMQQEMRHVLPELERAMRKFARSIGAVLTNTAYGDVTNHVGRYSLSFKPGFLSRKPEKAVFGIDIGRREHDRENDLGQVTCYDSCRIAFYNHIGSSDEEYDTLPPTGEVEEWFFAELQSHYAKRESNSDGAR